jgi:hypothetical protein
MLIGYAGGGVRNIFSNKPATNMAELQGLKVRVQGAPIWSRTFRRSACRRTVIAYNEVYNAIQNGVINAGENEAAGVEQMKFFEVGPNLLMTSTPSPSGRSASRARPSSACRASCRPASVKAGKEAGATAARSSRAEDEQKLDALEKAGKLKRIPFTERAR